MNKELPDLSEAKPFIDTVIETSEFKKWGYEDLKCFASKHCIDVFNDYDAEEIKKFSPSIQYCWRIGAQLSELQ